mmetsp:Transcript_54115/g.150522  ORF Transcript_54115/g.150522 Transcript_54115/m.150522 type:complete len:221 (+) Transcript_54115:1348-2010(+)
MLHDLIPDVGLGQYDRLVVVRLKRDPKRVGKHHQHSDNEEGVAFGHPGTTASILVQLGGLASAVRVIEINGLPAQLVLLEGLPPWPPGGPGAIDRCDGTSCPMPTAVRADASDCPGVSCLGIVLHHVDEEDLHRRGEVLPVLDSNLGVAALVRVLYLRIGGRPVIDETRAVEPLPIYAIRFNTGDGVLDAGGACDLLRLIPASGFDGLLYGWVYPNVLGR